MSPIVHVTDLTKRYGRTIAVDGISFEVQRGEILGILGPNGAGKTTTMRILSCFVMPTGGRVIIDGLDVLRDSLSVRERLGYLSESAALYPDLRVREYLYYRARLRGLHGKRLRGRVAETMRQCGLDTARDLVIGRLSKGYRKRVALADSIVHDPHLLIMDEPTLGLDPNQVRQVRALIKSLTETHTVVLCTGNLHEAEQICRRVLIMNEGRIVAADSPGNLLNDSVSVSHFVMDVHASAQSVLPKLEAIPDIVQIAWDSVDGWARFELDCARGMDIRPDLFRLGRENDWQVRELRMRRATLEEAFSVLTSEASAAEAETQLEHHANAAASAAGREGPK